MHRTYTQYKKLYYKYFFIIHFLHCHLVCSFRIKYKNVMFLDKYQNEISLHSNWLQCMLHIGLQQSLVFQNLVICEI